MSFTNPLRGKVSRGFDLNKPLPANVRWEQLDKISHATGYFFSFPSVEAPKMPGQLALREGFLRDLYAGIAQPYRLKMSLNSSERIALDLSVVRGTAPQSVHA